MTISAEQFLSWFAALMWPFIRISAMLLVTPIFGAQSVSVRVRLTLGLLLTLIVAMRLPEPPLIDPISLNGLLVAMQQVLIGVSMGFVLQIMFSALTQAGESVALSMGLGFASAIDPAAGVQVPIVSQFFVILATLLFLALNGHLVLIELLLRSFDTLPIGLDGLGNADLWSLLQFASTMYAGALLIALPAMASVLMVNLAMGVVARAAPQLNIFAVGFPVMMMAGFVLLVLMLPGLGARFEELLGEAFRLLGQILRI